jgi:hypothetical protein
MHTAFDSMGVVGEVVLLTGVKVNEPQILAIAAMENRSIPIRGDGEDPLLQKSMNFLAFIYLP